MSSDQTYYDERKKNKLLYDKIISRWTHRHAADEGFYDYEFEHLDWCQTCKDRYLQAVEDKEVKRD